jgi:hypothetical protein
LDQWKERNGIRNLEVKKPWEAIGQSLEIRDKATQFGNQSFEIVKNNSWK